MAHAKKAKADNQLKLQQEHAKQVAQEERKAFQKRFPGASGSLPAGWKMLIDPATGKPYYVAPDGHTQWEKPGGAGGIGPDGKPIDSKTEGQQEEARAKNLLDKA